MMCGEWHLGFWLSPCGTRAKGNMPLAAVPVIYADVHFAPQSLAEKQAGQRVDFPVPVRASDERVFQNPLYGFKVGAVDNRLMHHFRLSAIGSGLPIVVPFVRKCFVV